MSNPFLDSSTPPAAAKNTGDANPFLAGTAVANDPVPRRAARINPKQLYKRGDNLLKSLQYYQQHPIEGWNAFDQVLPRAIGGALGANGLRDVPRSTVDAVMHPGQVAQQDDRVARNLHLAPTKALQSQTLSDAAADPTTQALSPDIGTANAISQLLGSRQVLRSGIELAENIPQLARKELDAGFWAVKGGGDALKALGNNPFFSTLYHAADALHPARQALQPEAYGRTVGRLAKANSAAARKTREFKDLLEPHKDFLNALNVDPSRSVRRTGAQSIAPEVMQRMDELTWAEMTPTARRQAQHAGLTVTPEMAAMPPGNTLNRYDSNYFPTQKTGRKAAVEALSDALPTVFRRSRANAGGYQNAGREGQVGDDIYEQLLGRYRSGARNVEQAHAQRDILNDIGFGPRPDVTTAVQQLRNARSSGNAYQISRAEDALKGKLGERAARQAKQAASLRPGARLTARNLNVDLNGRPLGNIFLPYESALMMARRSDRIQGNDPNPAFKTQGNIPTNELLDLTAIGPQDRRMRDAQSAFTRAEKTSKVASDNAAKTRAAAATHSFEAQKRVQQAVNSARGDLASDLFGLAGNADRAASDTGAAASMAAMQRQRAVEEATNTAEGKLTARDQARAERAQRLETEVQNRASRATGGSQREELGPGHIWNLPNLKPITQGVVKGTRKALQISRPVFDATDRALGEIGQSASTLQPIRKAAITKDVDDIVRPSQQVAKQSGTIAGRAMDGRYHNRIDRAATGRSVQAIVNPARATSITANRNARAAASNFLRQKGKRDSIELTNNAVNRVSALAREHLQRTGNLTVPNALDHLFFGDNTSLEGLAKLNPMNKLAELTRAATFTMAAPHGNNILDQTLQGGPGLKGAIRGAGRAIQAHRHDPALDSHIQQLREVGQDSNYAGHDAIDYSKIPLVGQHVKRLADAGQHALDSFDTGQKIAAMEHLVKRGVKPDQLAHEMQKIYGGAPRSLLEQVAKAIGVYYPSFAMSTVPKTVANAMLHHPRAVNSMMLAQAIPTRRSEESGNPHEYNLFPELNEGREALAFPFGTADYAMKKVNSAHALYDAAHGSLSAIGRDVRDVIPFNQLIDLAGDAVNPHGRQELGHSILELLGPRITPESKRQVREKKRRAL